jgi:hypothetical protein
MFDHRNSTVTQAYQKSDWSDKVSEDLASSMGHSRAIQSQFYRHVDLKERALSLNAFLAMTCSSSSSSTPSVAEMSSSSSSSSSSDGSLPPLNSREASLEEAEGTEPFLDDDEGNEAKEETSETQDELDVFRDRSCPHADSPPHESSAEVSRNSERDRNEKEATRETRLQAVAQGDLEDDIDIFGLKKPHRSRRCISPPPSKRKHPESRNWTETEVEALKRAFARYGSKWVKIKQCKEYATALARKDANQLRAKHRQLSKQKKVRSVVV